MPFNTALSGLNAANADLKITGNNIANASTVGFKSSRAEFGDVYATTILGSGSNTIGSGVKLQNVSQQFTQGNVSFTENSLDLAISGSGFFVLNNGGDQAFTRAGTFGLDKDGFIVNNLGATLQGFAADVNGNISGVLGDLQIQTGNQPPRQTTLVESVVNVDSTEEVLQRSGTTFVTDGNAIGVAQVGQLTDTASTLLGGNFGLPILNDFTQDAITFDVTLAGAAANNGTVSITLDNANGMPPSITSFNDLRTLAGVINGQIFSPNNVAQSPIDVVATAVDDGGGNYHLEFASLVSGESSQVSINAGNVATTAQTIPGTATLAGTEDFLGLDPATTAATLAGTASAVAGIDFGTGAPTTIDFSLDGGATTTQLVLSGVATTANTAATVTAINTQIGLTAGLTGQIQAVAIGDQISFETVGAGSSESLLMSAVANDVLGLTPQIGSLYSGTDGASFDLAVNGGVPQTVILSGITIASADPNDTVTAVQAAVDLAVGAGVVTVSLNAGNQIFFESVGTGATNTLEVTSVDGVTDILGLTATINQLARGGDSAAVIGLPLGASSIADSSGRPAVDNGYPTQTIDVTDPSGNTVTYSAAQGNSAAQTASEMNALSGVSATATTTATIISYNNTAGNSVIQLNGVSLTGDTLLDLSNEINALTTSTLPGITAVVSPTTGTLEITSAVGDDLQFLLSSTDDGDSLEIQGVATAPSQILEADPNGDGTATSTPAQTAAGATVLTGAEDWTALVPSPSFDISVDGAGFINVDLGAISNPGSLAQMEIDLQTAVDAALVANGLNAGDVDVVITGGQVSFDSAASGSARSLRIAGTTGTDVLGLGGLVGTLYQGADGTNVIAEGINGNPNAINIGGQIDIVLDEGYTASNPTPPAIGLFGPFTATTFQAFVINQFDPTDQATYNHATSVTVFDSLGNSHVMTQYFVKQPYDPNNPATSPNHWLMYALVDGQDVGDPDTTLPPPQNTQATRASYNIHFNQDGSLNTLISDPILISNWDPLDANGQPNGALGPQNVLQGGTLPVAEPPSSSNFEIDLAGSTQFGSEFAVNDVDQNGFTTGRLSGIDIDDDGTLFARFTNGEAQVLAQIALADFPNEQGLQPAGDTMWAENFESGVPNISAPGTAALGVINSGALEESNVDLSAQLVNLIIAQRNFQANAKTIETADQTTQTIINLR
jgi:flagellar hook protein FlgE